MIRLFKHYFSRSLLTLMAAEGLHLFWSVYLGRTLRLALFDQGPVPPLLDTVPSAVVFALVMLIIMVAMGLYERNFWNGRSDMLLRVGVSFLFGFFVLTLVYYLIPELYLGRGEMSLAFVIAFFGVLLLRFAFVHVTDHSLLKPRLLVLGVGQQAARLQSLQDQGTTGEGFEIVGYLRLHDDEVQCVPEARMLNMAGSLSELVDAQRVTGIVVAMDDRRKGFPADEVLECKINGVRVSNFLSFYERQTGKIQLDALRPSNMIFSSGFRQAHRKQLAKRLFDIVTSLLLLGLTWPLMLGATLAIWLESGCRGPILYRQTRVGRGERLFDVIKFRSMRTDAERDGVARWAQAGDSRITRVGAVLRETRIDELPQLLNVLRGDMSFVGPRPERPQFVEQLRQTIPFYSMRHLVNPGITGWAQICYPYGASDQDAYEKLQYDLYYIKNYSFFLDVLVLLQTAHTILWGQGAR
ncbi:MAG TPA: TIGR03013 family PEP-CTERM/XrtA system glycosyltransferase [Candidatus Competibacteraceae bacterium]|nr:TIGR03013 family PEP-CTERM/XrtA system glycosyltransferase [Candidatus Competibacteraceae bacterium]